MSLRLIGIIKNAVDKTMRLSNDGGLCYMHAPVVLQHYLVAMNNAEPTSMLNVAEFLKKKMNGTNPHQRIWHNEGMLGIMRAEVLGCHAMVVIGQKGWRHSYVEVDSEYLLSSNATVQFIKQSSTNGWFSNQF
ncbi:hypothetical protein BJ741DRAFT_580002 [Chytriomyces cf. hyalinus JEL632]|nr:hypothetical protein BJ741DRAFT_580002 [Chytriomyces cf. hyalinus JEL632]